MLLLTYASMSHSWCVSKWLFIVNLFTMWLFYHSGGKILRYDPQCGFKIWHYAAE